jgi:3-hydroxyisobutyrate dehydrogenase-like beta-hydroxyacid dehydrogenase
MSTSCVGVIGLGNMGGGLAKHLVRSKWPLIVWDIDANKRRPFEGMQGVAIAAPGEMARSCEAIYFLVPATPQIRECTGGPDGIFQQARTGLILLDLTASDPLETQKIAADASRAGVDFLDAATSGGPTRADTGELLLMVGGEADAVRRARPFMERVARHIFHVGPAGAGHTLKLIHNNLTFTIFVATCEAGRQAEHAGIVISDMIEIFNKSNARSYASEERFPRHILSRTWDGRSSIYLLYKDLKLGVNLCNRLVADANLTQATLDFVERAMGRGMADLDYTLLYRDYESIRATPITQTK